jgi:hypothetical protein
VPHTRPLSFSCPSLPPASLCERLSRGELLAGASEALAVRDLARGIDNYVFGERLRDCPKHLLGDMTREAGQGSGSSERMRGYDQFISLLFCVLQIIYVSYIHLCCFICTHEFISSVLSYYNMLHLLVLILQSCCLCCYLFI